MSSARMNGDTLRSLAAATPPASARAALARCRDSASAVIVWRRGGTRMSPNGAARALFGMPHPTTRRLTSIATPAHLWKAFGTDIDAVLRSGEVHSSDDIRIVVRRGDRDEEIHVCCVHHPFPAAGPVEGVLTSVIDVTDRVIQARRLRVLHALASAVNHPTTGAAGLHALAAAMRDHAYDIPLALIYERAGDGCTLRLSAAVGVAAREPAIPQVVDLHTRNRRGLAQLLAQSADNAEVLALDALDTLLDLHPATDGVPVPREGLLLPMHPYGRREAVGVLLAAADPHHPLDADYRAFFELLAGQCAAVAADAALFLLQQRQIDDALRNSEHELADFFEHAAIGLCWVSAQGVILRANQTELAMLGYAAHEYIGRHVAQFHVDPDAVTDVMRRLRRHESVQEFEARVRCKDGTVKSMLIDCSARWNGNDFVHARFFMRDITARKLAEQALFSSHDELEIRVQRRTAELAQTNLALRTEVAIRRKTETALKASEQRYRGIVETAQEGIWVLDAAACTTFVNPQMARMLGYSADEIGARPIFDFLSDDDRAVAARLFEQRPLVGNRRYDLRFRRSDGTDLWTIVSASQLYDEHGAPDGILQMVTDITERKATADKLAEYTERLRVLSRRLLEVQEGERRHIARELHDEIGQRLTALKITLQAVSRSASIGDLLPVLADGASNVGQILDQVRRLSLNLRPSMLDDLGLAAALRWYMDRQAQVAGFAVRMNVDGAEERLAPEVETACFRVAQEAVTNIVRHAHARNVSLELRRKPHALQLTVHDDGVGFDVRAAQKRSVGGASFGLLGMQERAVLAGGELTIESSAGAGTTVRARFPLLDADATPRGDTES